MEHRDNYLIQAKQAKERFLTYDQQKLIRKFGLEFDEDYFYVNLLCKQYRLSRTTGDLQRESGDGWRDANTYNEVMTLLDLMCDSRDDRCLAGSFQNMQTFGLQFHQNLLEEPRDPFAALIDGDPQLLHRAAEVLGAEKIRGGDYGYAFELFDGLKIALLFWHGDEEFAPRVRYLWDENATQYLRYETMHFAKGMLLEKLKNRM